MQHIFPLSAYTSGSLYQTLITVSGMSHSFIVKHPGFLFHPVQDKPLMNLILFDIHEKKKRLSPKNVKLYIYLLCVMFIVKSNHKQQIPLILVLCT